jgi:GNAT superfamily N-acetyltransferase
VEFKAVAPAVFLVVSFEPMIEVREIPFGQTEQIAEPMLALRPRWKTVDAVVAFIDDRLRPGGYRLAGAFDPTSGTSVAVVGFRELWSTAWRHCLYIDDVSTVAAARGHGYADALLRWVIDEARRRGCEAVHLDSGVGSDRAAAHRLYMRHRLQISAHHFSLRIDQ